MKFINPGQFVPVKAQSRPQGTDLAVSDFDAGKTGHVTHAHYVPDMHSGRLVCRLTTVTPTVLGGKRDGDQAPAHVEPATLDGRPVIPSTSLRGMFGSLAEAASCSALRVLENEWYSYRKRRDPSESLSAIGMVKRDGNTYKLLPLCLPTLDYTPGQIAVPHRWAGLFTHHPSPPLKVYIGDRAGAPDSSIISPTFPLRTWVAASPKYYSLPLTHLLWSNPARTAFGAAPSLHRPTRPNGQPLPFVVGQKVLQGHATDHLQELDTPGVALPAGHVRGIVRVLGVWGDRETNIPEGKKHELFLPFPQALEDDFNGAGTRLRLIPGHVVERFHALADQRTDEDDTLPYEPRDTSRNGSPDAGGFRLKTGDLVYFTIDGYGHVSDIALSSIWRGRVEHSTTGKPTPATSHDFFLETGVAHNANPEQAAAQRDVDLLPFHPGRSVLTIAEQMFGFVEDRKTHGAEDDRGARALASRLVFSDALLERVIDQGASGFRYDKNNETGGAGNPFLPRTTLKALGSPKPPCPPMYFQDKANPMGPAIPKSALNPRDHRPLGRKMYAHNPDAENGNTWTSQSNKVEAKMKASVLPLKVGAEFWFTIDFDNLSDTELDLLCYALCPTGDFHHKIGMGKSLGLGTVKVEVAGLYLVDRPRRYTKAGFFEPRYRWFWQAGVTAPAGYQQDSVGGGATTPPAERAERFAGEMDTDVREAITHIGRIPDLGADTKVHTPLVAGRWQQPATREEETFKWFVRNDQGQRKAMRPASGGLSTLDEV
jgi:hypothetical protein